MTFGGFPFGGSYFGGDTVVSSLDLPTRNIDSSGRKTFLVHVYNEENEYICTWADLIDTPKFKWTVNNGQSAMLLSLKRRWGSTGELGEPGTLGDVVLGNRCKVYVIDRDTDLEGILIFQGVIDDYSQDLGGDDVEVSIVPLTAQLDDGVFESQVTITTTPQIMMALLVLGGAIPGLTSDPSNPAGTDVYVGTAGPNEKLRQVFDRVQKLAGGSWFYRINPDNTLTFNQWSSRGEPDHVLYIGKHVDQRARFRKSRMEYYQRVIVNGAPGITASASAVGYDPTFERRDVIYNNTRISDVATASRIAHSLLEYYSQPMIEITVSVLDSNFNPEKGYDIESLKPGQTVSILHPDNVFYFNRWGDDSFWGDGDTWGGEWNWQVQRPWPIAELNYDYLEATITLRNRIVSVPEEVVNLADRLLLVGG